MTDTEIAIAALQSWPVEARPKRVIACDHILTTGQYLTVFGRDNEDDIAIALFAAAGMEWLLRSMPPDSDKSMSMLTHEKPTHDRGERFGVWQFVGPTLLSAIDAAIRSIK